MNPKFIAEAEVIINAPIAKLWEASTGPESIKRYLSGAEVTTDWRVSGSITFRGESNGNRYGDNGKLLQIELEELLVSTFRSSPSGLPDAPENCKTDRYKLRAEGEGPKLILTQGNNDDQESAEHPGKIGKLSWENSKRYWKDDPCLNRLPEKYFWTPILRHVPTFRREFFGTAFPSGRRPIAG